MKTLFRKIAGCLTVVLAAACALFLYAVWHSPVFEGGTDYTLYAAPNSSARSETPSSPLLFKLLAGGTGGESVSYEGDRLQELVSRFRARLLFEEEVCGVRNYYFYSPYLKGCVLVGGQRVNLHIAVGEGRTVAGTPIIFGGF